jgi:3-carboxy-cis,cis-muconate cycloisomerase
MRANLESTGGLIMAEAVTIALGRSIGKLAAHHLVEEASKKAMKEQRHLDEVVSEDPRITKHLKPDEIARLFDPLAYQGESQAFIDRLIASARKSSAR